MAIHMYLKLDSITGEASAKGYEDQIEVLSWTWGLTQSGSAHHGSGTGTAGVTVGDLSIVKYVDRSTPTLIKYCCGGTFFDNAKLTVLKAGTSPTPYLALELMKGLVTSVNSGGVGPEERLIETISFNFKAFKIGYTPQKDGKPGAVIPAGWDIPKNTPVGSGTVVLRPDERLKPSLLDRLTDDEPTETREAIRMRFASARSLRESVVRDLGWLLNSVRLSSVEDLAAYPYAARSALNFGLPDLAGRTLTSIDVPALEAELRQAIIHFEPRLVADTVEVAVRDTQNELGINSMQFTIDAMLMAYPAPLALCLRTEIDLETGDVSVSEWENGRPA